MKRLLIFLLLIACWPLACSTERPLGYARARADACLTGKVELSGINQLAPACRHVANIRITRSDTVVDCQGGSIDAAHKGAGIDIDSQGQRLENVTIKNCTVLNAGRGIGIGWSAPDRSKGSLPRAAIYEATPRHIRLENVTVMNSSGTGIYIDDYVSDVLLDRVTVRNNGGVGIYIEHSSRGTTIRQSDISHNGHKIHREGIAIDSSADNTIIDSTIENNANGGIYIYRNCSEHFNENPNQVKRWQSADRNIIRNNRISGSPTGIWVASRQSKDTSQLNCGNGYYAEGRYTLDSARNNEISGNTVSTVERGVVVEDDENKVIGNTFSNIRNVAVLVGSGPRYKYLGKPVTGVVVRDNKFSGSGEKVKFTAGSQP